MLEPVALAGDGHDVGMMQQPVQQRGRQRRVLRKCGVPLPERQVARHDQAALFVQRRDHLEEQVGLLAVHRQIADFVDNEQAVGFDGPVHHRLQTVLLMCRAQGQQQVERSHEARLNAGLRGLLAQCHRQVGFAHAAGADQYHVLVALDEA